MPLHKRKEKTRPIRGNLAKSGKKRLKIPGERKGEWLGRGKQKRKRASDSLTASGTQTKQAC